MTGTPPAFPRKRRLKRESDRVPFQPSTQKLSEALTVLLRGGPREMAFLVEKTGRTRRDISMALRDLSDTGLKILHNTGGINGVYSLDLAAPQPAYLDGAPPEIV